MGILLEPSPGICNGKGELVSPPRYLNSSLLRQILSGSYLIVKMGVSVSKCGVPVKDAAVSKRKTEHRLIGKTKKPKKVHRCRREGCSAVLSTAGNRNKHERRCKAGKIVVEEAPVFRCNCGTSFRRRFALKRHVAFSCGRKRTKRKVVEVSRTSTPRLAELEIEKPAENSRTFSSKLFETDTCEPPSDADAPSKDPKDEIDADPDIPDFTDSEPEEEIPFNPVLIPPQVDFMDYFNDEVLGSPEPSILSILPNLSEIWN